MVNKWLQKDCNDIRITFANEILLKIQIRGAKSRI